MSNVEIVLSIKPEIFDEEIKELQGQEQEKISIKQDGKGLAVRFLKSNKNIRTEAFPSIAILEKLYNCKKILWDCKIKLRIYSSQTTEYISYWRIGYYLIKFKIWACNGIRISAIQLNNICIICFSDIQTS